MSANVSYVPHKKGKPFKAFCGSDTVFSLRDHFPSGIVSDLGRVDMLVGYGANTDFWTEVRLLVEKYGSIDVRVEY